MLSDWLLIATVVAILWGLWLLLSFVLDMLDKANPRPDGGKRNGTAGR